MTGTSVIYTNILEVSRMDNIGLEVAWAGTPTGVILVLVSNSGVNWSALTFTPAYANPAGSAGVETLDLNQLPFKYVMVQYTNASGSGTIQIFAQCKDIN
jgi:hypothetical protein